MQGNNILVSLLEMEESDELELLDEPSICQDHSIEFISFPIKDRSIPSDTVAFLKLVERLIKEIDNGNKRVIHCRMGIGRTGVLAAGILIHRGYDPNTIFEFLSKVRTLDAPDTAEQTEWVKKKAL